MISRFDLNAPFLEGHLEVAISGPSHASANVRFAPIAVIPRYLSRRSQQLSAPNQMHGNYLPNRFGVECRSSEHLAQHLG